MMGRLLEWIHQIKDTLFEWMDQIATSPHPGWWLFLLAFAESSFFPIPPDVLLITLGVATPERAITYGMICSVASVLGGAFGYGIGLYGGRPLLSATLGAADDSSDQRDCRRHDGIVALLPMTSIPFRNVEAGVSRSAGDQSESPRG